MKLKNFYLQQCKSILFNIRARTSMKYFFSQEPGSNAEYNCSSTPHVKQPIFISPYRLIGTFFTPIRLYGERVAHCFSNHNLNLIIKN